ncbi:MAG TPA: LUD domain-containing protein [Jatrophihabitans sp.]
MTAQPAARDEVLSRIRRAIGESADLPVEREYRRAGSSSMAAEELLHLLVDRLEDYKATVVRCADTDGDIAAAVGSLLQQRAVDRLVTPIGITDSWLAADRQQPDEPPLSVAELDGAAGVLTGCSVAIAETGTIVLDAGPMCGRRAITLVPDLHLCVVRSAQVVHSVPDGIARLDPTQPLTFISGPSATSDIELNRVEGVHGPRQLVVILAA